MPWAAHYEVHFLHVLGPPSCKVLRITYTIILYVIRKALQEHVHTSNHAIYGMSDMQMHMHKFSA